MPIIKKRLTGSFKIKVAATIVINGIKYIYALDFIVPKSFIAFDHEAKHIAEAQHPKNSRFRALTGFKNLANPKWQSEKHKNGIINIIPYKKVFLVMYIIENP